MKARNKHAVNPLMARCVAHGKTGKAVRVAEKRKTQAVVGAVLAADKDGRD